MLISLFVRIGIVENPVIARQVTAMSVLSHNVLTDYFDLACAVLIQIKSVSVRRVPGPGKDMACVSPEKV